MGLDVENEAASDEAEIETCSMFISYILCKGTMGAFDTRAEHIPEAMLHTEQILPLP